jgi:flagellar biosynthesis protein FlhG
MKLLSTKYHENHFNLVVNQVSKDSDALMVFKKLTMVASRYLDVSLDYLGSIPHDRQLIETIRRQRVVSEMYPHAKSAIAFANLAARLCLEPISPEPKGGLQFFWKKLLSLGTGG